MASLNGLGLREGVDSRSDSTGKGERCKYGLFEKVLSWIPEKKKFLSTKEKRSEKKEKVLLNDCLKFLGKIKSLHGRTLQDFLTEETTSLNRQMRL